MEMKSESVHIKQVKKKKICAVRCHDGSLCTQQHPETAAFSAAIKNTCNFTSPAAVGFDSTPTCGSTPSGLTAEALTS